MGKKEKRKASSLEAYSTLIVMVLCLAIGTSVLHFDLKMMMLTSCIFSIIVVIRLGYSWSEIQDIIAGRFKDVSGMFIIFFGIGFLISSWMISGTVPVLVLWLAQLVSPKFVLALSFILVAILSSLIGTSFASMGTLGVIMFSLCQVQGIPAGISAAAVICGAFFGTYISPVSDIFNLNALLNRVPVHKLIKVSLLPAGLGAIVTSVFFFIIGTKYVTSSMTDSLTSIQTLATDITSAFSYTGWIVVIPMLVCIGLCMLKKPAPIALFVSGFIAIIIGVLFQNYSLGECLYTAYYGFSSATMIDGELSKIMITLLDRGGILSMGDGMIFFMFSVADIAIIERTNAFDKLLTLVLGEHDKKGNIHKLNLTLSSFSILFTAAAGDTSPTATITSRAFRKRYLDAGYDPVNLAKFNSISGNVAMMYLPWSFCAWYGASIYGIQVLDYAPYAILFWVVPLIALILSFFGIGNVKSPEGYKEEITI